MIVKILNSSSADFHGVKYNEKKIGKGTGELMKMKNFPSFINEKSSQEQVRDYFKSISKSQKIKKPQFHCVISTKFQQNSKEELSKVAENFMEGMGYANQPYLVVFHNDTDNNHVHIVSTRVDRETGKKLNDSYEKLRAQKVLNNSIEKLYGYKVEDKLEKLLSYKIGTTKQLEILLERNGYKLVRSNKNENALDILKNGVKEKTIDQSQIVFDHIKNDSRSRQIKTILSKYKDIYSNKVFRVEDNRARMFGREFKESISLFEKKSEINGAMKIDFESELQKKLRDVFGIDIVFHSSEGKIPFGYSIIDYKSEKIYKGSELMKMDKLFEFTSDKIDKKLFEIIKDYNVPNGETKKVLSDFFNKNHCEYKVKEFMLFENKGRKDLETYRKVQRDTKEFIRDFRNVECKNTNIQMIKTETGKYYTLHTKHHYVSELKTLLRENEYQRFINSEGDQGNELTENQKNRLGKNEILQIAGEMLNEFMKSSGVAKDPNEDEFKKRRKKRK